MPTTRRSARNSGKTAPARELTPSPAPPKASSKKITFDEDFEGYDSKEEEEEDVQIGRAVEDDDHSDSDVEEVQNTSSKESALKSRELERLASKFQPKVSKKKKKKKKPTSDGIGNLSADMLAAVAEELEKRRAKLLQDINEGEVGAGGNNKHTKFTYEDDSEKLDGVVADENLEVVWTGQDEEEDEEVVVGKKKKKKKKRSTFKLFGDGETFTPIVDSGAEVSNLVDVERLTSIKKRAKFKR
ncbi:hypothetical protein TrLO_g15282 [Triparma laevis f. longispina]|uniref:Uncharacterized protein n=1 Tax=Triparma laevis f. longispina TaxID=1714387 RepID=A0A9W7FCX5_9STRA|nr:hypothetical protein TrLO_g15282 [Triparma laevis f. longispina]